MCALVNPLSHAGPRQYVYVRGWSCARQLSGKLRPGLGQKCGITYDVIKADVGLKQPQAVSGGFRHHHLESALLEILSDRAVVDRRIGNQKRGPRSSLSEERRTGRFR